MSIPYKVFGTGPPTRTGIGAFSLIWGMNDGEVKKSSFSNKKYTRFPPRRFRFLTDNVHSCTKLMATVAEQFTKGAT